MSIENIMTRDPACCTPESPLQQVATLMLENDCGEIPIVNDLNERRLVGVVTDRDIAVRGVAAGLDAATTAAADVMTDSVVTVRANEDVSEACEKMEEYQIRRVPVVDAQGCVVGIVAQADIALKTNESDAGEVVKDVSRRGRFGGASANRPAL